MFHERPTERCPICNCTMRRNRDFNYVCFAHGEYKKDWVTGKLVEVPKKEKK